VSDEQDLDDWDAIEEAHDDHVARLATVMLAQRFSEMARAEALRAEERLVLAQRRAENARAHLERTSTTLERAVRLYSLRRE